MNSIETSSDLHSELVFKVKTRLKEVIDSKIKRFWFCYYNEYYWRDKICLREKEMSVPTLRCLSAHLDCYEKVFKKIDECQWESQDI